MQKVTSRTPVTHLAETMPPAPFNGILLRADSTGLRPHKKALALTGHHSQNCSTSVLHCPKSPKLLTPSESTVKKKLPCGRSVLSPGLLPRSHKRDSQNNTSRAGRLSQSGTGLPEKQAQEAHFPLLLQGVYKGQEGQVLWKFQLSHSSENKFSSSSGVLTSFLYLKDKSTAGDLTVK